MEKNLGKFLQKTFMCYTNISSLKPCMYYLQGPMTLFPNQMLSL